MSLFLVTLRQYRRWSAAVMFMTALGTSACSEILNNGNRPGDPGTPTIFPTGVPLKLPSPNPTALPPPAPVVVTPALPTYLSNDIDLTISGTCVDGDGVILTGAASTFAPCSGGVFGLLVTGE